MSWSTKLGIVCAVVGCVTAVAHHRWAEAMWAATAGIWAFIAGLKGA